MIVLNPNQLRASAHFNAETSIRKRANGQSVLMVIHSDFPATGGAEIQAARLAMALVNKGWHVRVVALPGNKISNNGAALGRLMPLYLRRPRIRGLAGICVVAHLAWVLIRERARYDVVHVHIIKTLAFVASVLGPLLGKKVVLKISGIELQEGILSEQHAHHFYYRLLNWGCRKADVIIAISRRIEGQLRRFGFKEEQVVYLPNGTDVQRFSPCIDKQRLRRQLGIQAEYMAVYVGRLSPEKGVYDLLHAWSSVCRAYPNAVLCIVGDGVLREGIQALVRADGWLKSAVHFTGTVPNVEQYLAAADCCISPSLEEGLSNTVLEAMSAGLPVVSTRVSGAEDLIQDGENGYLVGVGNSEELAFAICRLFSDLEQARAMGDKSRSKALEWFDMSRIVERYERIYNAN